MHLKSLNYESKWEQKVEAFSTLMDSLIIQQEKNTEESTQIYWTKRNAHSLSSLIQNSSLLKDYILGKC